MYILASRLALWRFTICRVQRGLFDIRVCKVSALRPMKIMEIKMNFSKSELIEIIKANENKIDRDLQRSADKVRQEYYGNSVYVRGLIEFTNYCKNDCYYCGIRRGNKNVARYRLSKEEILSRCEAGDRLGFKTFVLQGGEDPYFTDDIICDIVSSIKERYPDCAVTLSIGEKSRESYKAYFDAGADRFLLRHETADESHYNRLHPASMSLKNRKRCLYDLKEIGYQVGAGFMVGSPYQTAENIADDILFLAELRPHMVGIGPFIPHDDTPFRDFKAGSLELTCTALSLTRLTLPYVLLPSTTALGTIAPNGRELGILSGANVVMPNLSPAEVRDSYSLYNNKLSSGAEAAESVKELARRMEKIGYKIDFSVGDAANLD